MGTTYQVKCDRCSKPYLTTDDTPPFWCGCELPADEAMPDCVIGHFPIRVDKWSEYTLPGVPYSEQCFVTDPNDRGWFFCIRTADVPRLRTWLAWYHAAKANRTTPPPK